jgi:hypothetical protein
VPDQFEAYFSKRSIIPKSFSAELAAEIRARSREQ